MMAVREPTTKWLRDTPYSVQKCGQLGMLVGMASVVVWSTWVPTGGRRKEDQRWPFIDWLWLLGPWYAWHQHEMQNFRTLNIRFLCTFRVLCAIFLNVFWGAHSLPFCASFLQLHLTLPSKSRIASACSYLPARPISTPKNSIDYFVHHISITHRIWSTDMREHVYIYQQMEWSFIIFFPRSPVQPCSGGINMIIRSNRAGSVCNLYNYFHSCVQSISVIR